ncbi:DUF397 domain-containing protein [Kitasatospora purpeofusca]|uniref:DUF397 domain-containing protein n=1 Tax=Kitasatospora purpeofusca TaxID=67352 RepID=UPI0022580898|nr:DUF397 domain-containing protein [Kitasatospora purpeofusca]MCX4688765.1 DUF397 domain-containing protein [Kitasatospora purpeofusca]
MNSELAWFKSSHCGDEEFACVEIAWHKSSHSGAEGGECVEVGWRKSTHSSGEGGECVEVAETTSAVLVRDSKDQSGPHLTFTPAAWEAFVAYARSA